MMKRKTLAVLVAILAVGAMAAAQGGPPQGGPPQGGPGGRMFFGGPGGPGGPGGNKLMLLQRNDVQTDLQLTADQKTKLSELQKKQRGQMRGPGGPGGPGDGGGEPPDPEQMRAEMEKRMKEQDAQVNAILTSDQQKRLKEIAIQLQGNSAILQEDVQKELGITDNQKDAIEAAMQAQRDQMDEMRENGGGPGEGGPGGDRQAMMAAMKKMQDSLNTELGKVLTTEQAAKLKAMGGKTFVRKDPERGPGFGGGRGPGGGGPGGGGPPPIGGGN